MRASPFVLGVAGAVTLVLATATSVHAQRLRAPEASPRATVQQTVGLTEITVTYNRPAVGGRTIWGQLVPYGEVWRAGANENTTVQFSSDVKVGGRPLRAGKYGLHMIPTARNWTVIFSTVNTAWGSYNYDQKEDALRVTVTPRPLPAHEERLAFRFDDPTERKVTLVLAWEKLAVPVSIEVDTPKVVMESMRAELRGSAGFTGEAWAQAASYWLRNGGPLDEAQRMIDRALTSGETYGALRTRAEIFEKKGQVNAAREARARAMQVATERDLNLAGYELLGEKKLDQAIAVFRDVVQRFPQSWNAHDSLAEALAIKGDKAGAIASYEKALAMVRDPVQRKRIEQTLAKLKK